MIDRSRPLGVEVGFVGKDGMQEEAVTDRIKLSRPVCLSISTAVGAKIRFRIRGDSFYLIYSPSLLAPTYLTTLTAHDLSCSISTSQLYCFYTLLRAKGIGEIWVELLAIWTLRLSRQSSIRETNLMTRSRYMWLF